MINAEKSNEQLINELMALYRRIEDLEPLGRHYKQTEQARMEIEERYKRLISAVPPILIQWKSEMVVQ